MKIQIFKQIMMLAAFTGAVSCISKDIPGGGEEIADGMGKLVIGQVGISENVKEKSTRAENVDKADFDVEIARSQSGYMHVQSKYGLLESSYQLPVGDYTLGIKSHDVEDFAWEKIYYTLSRNFAITNGQTTNLDDLVCKVGNILVSIHISPKMKSLMGDDCLITVKVGNIGPVAYMNTAESDEYETRRGCFRAAETTNSLVWEFSGTLDGIDGLRYDNTVEYDIHARAGEHHKLNFDVESGTGVLGTFTVVADHEVVDVNLNVEVEEEVEEPFEESIEFSSTLSMEEVNTLNMTEYVNGSTPLQPVGMIVAADNGIAEAVVTITSGSPIVTAALAGAGITAPFDLVTVQEPLKTTLTGFGFPTGDAVEGETAINVELTNMLPMLFGLTQTAGNYTMNIKVAVRDQEYPVVATGNLSLRIVDDTQAPTITITGSGIDAPMEIRESETTQGPPPTPNVRVDISAPAGIAGMTVAMSSTSDYFQSALAPIGTLDLINPGANETLLQGLGIPYGDDVLGETEFPFDISGFVSMIFMTGTDKPEFDAAFTVTVTDGAGNTFPATINLHLINDVN